MFGLSAGLDCEHFFEALVVEDAEFFVDLARQAVAFGDQALRAHEHRAGHAPELEEKLAQRMKMLGKVHADRAALHEIHVVVASGVGDRETARDDARDEAQKDRVDGIGVEMAVDTRVF